MTPTPKRGPGRPKKPDDQKHSKQIKLMVTPAQKAIYEALGDEESDMMRDMMRELIEKTRS